MAEEKIDMNKPGYRKKLRDRAVSKAMGKGKATSSEKKEPSKTAAKYLDSPKKKAKQ